MSTPSKQLLELLESIPSWPRYPNELRDWSRQQIEARFPAWDLFAEYQRLEVPVLHPDVWIVYGEGAMALSHPGYPTPVVSTVGGSLGENRHVVERLLSKPAQALPPAALHEALVRTWRARAMSGGSRAPEVVRNEPQERMATIAPFVKRIEGLIEQAKRGVLRVGGDRSFLDNLLRDPFIHDELVDAAINQLRKVTDRDASSHAVSEQPAQNMGANEAISSAAMPVILFPDQLPLPRGDAKSQDPIARWHAVRPHWGRPRDPSGGRPVEMNLQTQRSIEEAALMAEILQSLLPEARAANPAHTTALLQMVRSLRGGLFLTTTGLQPTLALLKDVDLIIADLEAVRVEKRTVHRESPATFDFTGSSEAAVTAVVRAVDQLRAKSPDGPLNQKQIKAKAQRRGGAADAAIKCALRLGLITADYLVAPQGRALLIQNSADPGDPDFT